MKISVNQEIVSIDNSDGITYEELLNFAEEVAKPDRDPDSKLKLNNIDMNILYNIVYSTVEKEMLIEKLKNIIKNISKCKKEFYAKTEGHHSCYILIFKLLGLEHNIVKNARTFIYTLADLHILWAKKNKVGISYQGEINTSKMVPLKYVKKKYVMNKDLQLGIDFKQNWEDPFGSLFCANLKILNILEETGNIVYCVSMGKDYPCKIQIS